MLTRLFPPFLIGALIALFTPPALGWHRLPAGPLGLRHAGHEGIRGVTVGPIESRQQPGRGYGTAASRVLNKELRELGANWVSITPFGRIWSLESTTIRMDFEAPYEVSRTSLKAMIRQAHDENMRVLVVPHLWVESGGWRGEMAPREWASYHDAYSDFVMRWARDAADAGADALSIGVECSSWSDRHGPVWEKLIRDVRGVFPGLLTYSANWDEVDRVLFWDQLDLVGINAFYPLAQDEDFRTATERTAAYRNTAMSLVPQLREVSFTLGMPVVFAEVGYTTRERAAVEPWLWPDNMEDVIIDEAEQERALAAVFDAFYTEAWFGGSFLWRYYSHLDDVSQEAIWGFSPHGKTAETLLRHRFPMTVGSDPAPLDRVRRTTPNGTWSNGKASASAVPWNALD